MGAGCGGVEPAAQQQTDAEAGAPLVAQQGTRVELDVSRASRHAEAEALAVQRPTSTLELQRTTSPSASSTVWVGGLPDWLITADSSGVSAEAELRRLFSAFGRVLGVSVREKPADSDKVNRSWALVTFAEADAVGKATAESVSIVSPHTGERCCLVVTPASITPPPRDTDCPRSSGGALTAMWATQETSVLKGLRSPMQYVLETLQQLATTVPSVAGTLEEVVEVLTTTEDLWAIHDSHNEGGAQGLTPRGELRRTFDGVPNAEVKGFLLNEYSNTQLLESEAYSAKLARSRAR